MKRSFYGTLIVFLAFTCVSLAAPKPAIVQGPTQWTLDTTFTHPQQIVLERSVDKKPVRFWYIIITITNNSGNDAGFYPKCDLVTDTFQIISAGQGVGSIVFDKIKERHKNKYPFLELLSEVDNKILQGEDNTKDIVVIWPDFDSEAKNINLFITGLSNETAEIECPVQAAKSQDGEQKKIYLRKTLQLKYNISGNPASSGGAALEYKGKFWVMR
ncbi:MAG: hypothetical protein JXA96_12235 [Sedimentisphaerales bacterium]|nr:hypothetical protein [Sedimentisphaerales bacterium]